MNRAAAAGSPASKAAGPSPDASPGPLPPGWYPRRALRALRALIENPDDTRHVFTIIESLSGRAPLRVFARFRASASGQRLLASRANILSILKNRAALEQMPDGSLGRAYLAFIDREQISAEGLVQASDEGYTGNFVRGPDFGYVSNRLRDTHDLWHAVSGYHGDLYGEAALLAFIGVQTTNPGVALIVLTALLKTRDPKLVRLVVRGVESGMKAEWLPSIEWEELLPLPLAEVRRRLRIEPVPAYKPVRTSQLRAQGELASV